MDDFLYSGCGNDFILFDDREKALAPLSIDSIQELCRQNCVDGILIVSPSTCAACKMQIFNADGSEAEMCGNGLRCVAAHGYANGLLEGKSSIETAAGILHVARRGEEIEASMPKPRHFTPNHATFTHQGHPYTFTSINTGVPHALTFIENIDDCPLETLAPLVRRAPPFQPRGTNVSFVAITPDKLLIRTYERGVEAETKSCGTAATAAAICAYRLYNRNPPTIVQTTNGCRLTINFDPALTTITQTGICKRLYPSHLG